jgi:hypothetical protein
MPHQSLARLFQRNALRIHRTRSWEAKKSRPPQPGIRRPFSRSTKRRSMGHVMLNLLTADRRGFCAPAAFFLAKRASGVAVPKVLSLACALPRFTLPQRL